MQTMQLELCEGSGSVRPQHQCPLETGWSDALSSAQQAERHWGAPCADQSHTDGDWPQKPTHTGRLGKS